MGAGLSEPGILRPGERTDERVRGAGGGGGVLTGTTNSVIQGVAYSITVGGGGSASSTPGPYGYSGAGTKGGNSGQWSARKAQLVAKKYKAAGGGYK